KTGERVTRHADTVAPMFQYVIHWQDSDKAPEAVLADRFEDEGDEYVFYTSLENGEEQRMAIPMGEVEIITLEGQEGVWSSDKGTSQHRLTVPVSLANYLRNPCSAQHSGPNSF